METPIINVHYEDDALESIEIGDKTFENTLGSSADTIIDAILYALETHMTGGQS